MTRSLDVSGFLLSESAHDAGSRLPRHAHDNSYFCFVLQGAYTEKCGRHEVLCKPSVPTFRGSGEEHEARVLDADVRVFVVEIPPRWIERLREDSLSLRSSSDFSGGALPRLGARIHREFHKTDTASPLAIEGLALELLAEAVRRPRAGLRATPPWLIHAREMIAERFAETLTLSEIAAEAGVHPVHLATTFREKYGVTIGDFVRTLRVEYACELIKKGLPLSAIAVHAGFADQNHFTRVFKSHMGTTPARYSRAIRS
ncbi:MAG TPA: AraC family transcriptional regulator [Thermoanaerobaculia bacterium]|nr:AraC family transcriptional regulator [Thermoanaerobaculia bacterium]